MNSQEPRAEELQEVREAQASRSEEVTGEEADLSQNKLKTLIMERLCGQGPRIFTQGGGETWNREKKLNSLKYREEVGLVTVRKMTRF